MVGAIIHEKKINHLGILEVLMKQFNVWCVGDRVHIRLVKKQLYLVGNKGMSKEMNIVFFCGLQWTDSFCSIDINMLVFRNLAW